MLVDGVLSISISNRQPSHKPACLSQHKRHTPLNVVQCLHPQVVDSYAAQSYRLLAVAYGEVRDVAKSGLAAMSLRELERQAGRLDLLGLVVMSNHLRPDSKDTIAHLQDRSVIH